jgi:hypothetical protein
MQILLRKYKVPQRSIDKIINREKSMKEQFEEENRILKDKIDKLEREIKIKDAWANEIKCNLWGYDGCENSIPGLRGLVDEAIDKSEKIMNCDDKSIVMSGFKHDEHGNRYVEHRNVLDEVLTEFTEEDQKIINWFRGEDNETN